jgi:phosphatidylglycerol:prolipoprotein diacylglycerol transferase
MHPILFELHFGSLTLPLHTYGFMIAIGFLSGIYLIRKLATRAGVSPDLVSDMAFWLLLYGFVGARVLFIITRFDYFLENPIDMFKVWEGGLVFFGGLLAATAYAAWYFVKHKLNAWKMIDILSPGVVIAHAFGRLGCLGAGCCYGRPTGEPWGIKLESELVDPPLRGIPLHPTQLYESVSLFILLGGMLYIFKHKKFDGQVGLTYFMLYPIIRSIIEIYRGDSIRGFVIDDVLSTSQFISILVFIGAFWVLWSRMKKMEQLSTHANRR